MLWLSSAASQQGSCEIQAADRYLLSIGGLHGPRRLLGRQWNVRHPAGAVRSQNRSWRPSFPVEACGVLGIPLERLGQLRRSESDRVSVWRVLPARPSATRKSSARRRGLRDGAPSGWPACPRFQNLLRGLGHPFQRKGRTALAIRSAQSARAPRCSASIAVMAEASAGVAGHKATTDQPRHQVSLLPSFAAHRPDCAGASLHLRYPGSHRCWRHRLRHRLPPLCAQRNDFGALAHHHRSDQPTTTSS